MGNPLKELIKNKLQGAAVNPYRFVKAGADDSHYIQAADATAAILGVSDSIATAVLGEGVDLQHGGILEIECGANPVTRGNYLTSDANGKATPANLTAGTTVYHGGIALQSAVAGDIFLMLFAPGVLRNDALEAIVDVTISSAELLALNAAPKQIIAAPGANKAIIVIDAQAFLDYNSAAYDGIAGGEDLVLAYTNGAGTALAKFETTGFLDQASDQMRVAAREAPVAGTNLTPTANAALVAALLVGEIATGNSPLKIRVHYRIIDTVL